MKEHRHEMEFLGKHDGRFGKIVSIEDHGHPLISADYRTYAYTVQKDACRRIIWNGKIMAEIKGTKELVYHYRRALSFDSKKLAVANAVYNGWRIVGYDISINGTVVYCVNFDTVYKFVWLDNERLAWECWNRKPGNIDVRYFINNQDVTGKFKFEFVGGDIVIMEGDLMYKIDKAGNRSESMAVNEDKEDGFRWYQPHTQSLFTTASSPIDIQSADGRSDATIESKFSCNDFFETLYAVQNGRFWKKGYPEINVGGIFFTPENELVIVAGNWRGSAVVIDENEGPWFSEVYAPCYLNSERAVVYLARKREKFFRVVVR